MNEIERFCNDCNSKIEEGSDYGLGSGWELYCEDCNDQ